MKTVITEWCDGALHMIILPSKSESNFCPWFSFFEKFLNKPMKNEIFSRSCVPQCPLFLKNGVDECGCFYNPVLEINKKTSIEVTGLKYVLLECISRLCGEMKNL